MKTYQDLLDCGTDEAARIAFIKAAIADHKGSALYKTAVDAKLYYDGENPTINRYEKIIYDMKGLAYKDMYSANHKIASRFFGFQTDQQKSYLLGNGVTLEKNAKKKLGKNFDQMVSRAAKYAIIGGVSFGFWNLDHMEVFKVTEFLPLYDEWSGALMAGIRFWQIDYDKPLCVTLFEPDGYTIYTQKQNENLRIKKNKRAYKQKFTVRKLFGLLFQREFSGEENYPAFPIIPLKNNEDGKSSLCGRRNTIDALDLACSNMVNNTDEGNLIYWVLNNYGGMDDLDDAKFLDRLRSSHVAHTENEGATIEPHSIEAPFEGTQNTIDMLEKKLYQDFQAFDASAVTAGQQTATAIKASYVPLDLKADDFEEQVTMFINGILELAGVEGEPTYTRNKIINVQEEIQSILMIAPYVTEDYLTRKLLTLLGDADKVDEILEQMAAENLDKFDGGDDDPPDKKDVSTTDEAIDAAEEATGKTLNGSQTSSLITVIRQLSAGSITEGQAVKILMRSIGATREEALAIIRGEE